MTIVAACVTLVEAMKAADELAKSGTNVRIIDPFTIKPLDGKTIMDNARQTGGRIVTVEDHYVEGKLSLSFLFFACFFVSFSVPLVLSLLFLFASVSLSWCCPFLSVSLSICPSVSPPPPPPSLSLSLSPLSSVFCLSLFLSLSFSLCCICLSIPLSLPLSLS